MYYFRRMKYETKRPIVLVQEVLEKNSMREIMDWGSQFIGASGLYGKSRGREAAIFIIDTSSHTDHPDLVANVYDPACRNFSDSVNIGDADGHSTHCAGIAAAVANGKGVIGVAPEATIVLLKSLNDIGQGFYSWATEAIKHAAVVPLPPHVKHRIINLSLSGPVANEDMAEAIEFAISKGCILVAAAGNDGYDGENDSVGFPGSYPSIITVASITKDGAPSDFSSGGESVDVAAPGSEIYSTHRNQAYAQLSGTSMASPHIAGVCALLKCIFGEAIADQASMKEYLSEISEDIYTPGRDNSTGAGVPKLLTPKQAVERKLSRKEQRKEDRSARRSAKRKNRKRGLGNFLSRLKSKRN